MKIHLIADEETFSTPQVFSINPPHPGEPPPRILVRWGHLELTMTIDEAEELSKTMLERCSAVRRPR